MNCVRCDRNILDNSICIHCGRGWKNESYVTNEDMSFQRIEWSIFWDFIPQDRECKTLTIVFKQHHPTEVVEEFVNRVFPQYGRVIFHTSGLTGVPHTCMRVDFMLED